ncbi:unnamed protein product, partial [Mesorhabditis belari]|uniref:Uncharacterized protein n=1 Tax=Mesorhabditis belari TaxID=2138241 RepID=A0AAF3EP23_9BILA
MQQECITKSLIETCTCDFPIVPPPFVAQPIGPTGQCTTQTGFLGCQNGNSPQDVLRFMIFDMNGNVLFDSGDYCAGDAINHVDNNCECKTVAAAAGDSNFPFCDGSYAPYLSCTNSGTDPVMCAAFG